eukprot:jgi/Botrbrau1/20858/Bobra.0561s0003.1
MGEGEESRGGMAGEGRVLEWAKREELRSGKGKHTQTSTATRHITWSPIPPIVNRDGPRDRDAVMVVRSGSCHLSSVLCGMFQHMGSLPGMMLRQARCCWMCRGERACAWAAYYVLQMVHCACCTGYSLFTGFFKHQVPI